jgi:hypothetical protein
MGVPSQKMLVIGGNGFFWRALKQIASRKNPTALWAVGFGRPKPCKKASLEAM